MSQPDPREFEKTRHTTLFPVPVKAYVLPVKAYELPVLYPEQVSLRESGLEQSDPETIETIRRELDYSWPEAVQVFVGHGGTWLLLTNHEQPHHLIPFPIVQVAYAKGDKIFRRTSRDEASLMCGVVTTPDSRSKNNTSWCDFNNESVRVLWDGESQDRVVMGRDIQLYRDEPRFKRP